MGNKTAEEIYESNRPKFYEWGTLKDMCLASMEEYASLQCAELQEINRVYKNCQEKDRETIKSLQSENESLKKRVEELESGCKELMRFKPSLMHLIQDEFQYPDSAIACLMNIESTLHSIS